MVGQTVGYVRVSSLDQNEDRQLEGVELDCKFMDKLSGKNTERPELQRMLVYVRQGDKLVVHSLDRLARNLADLLSLVKQLNDKGVEVHFLKENLVFNGNNNTPMSMLMLSMLGAFAEFERALIKERQREGIEIAKKKGVYKGRKPSLNKTQAEDFANVRLLVNPNLPSRGPLALVARLYISTCDLDFSCRPHFCHTCDRWMGGINDEQTGAYQVNFNRCWRFSRTS